MEKAKIIVIDDDESICRLCQKIFEREGYAAAFFTQSLDAVDRLKKEHFDVALIDLSMPGKNGIEVIKDIKVISEDTSVLVMSAFPTVESVVESMKLGVCDYISKPFEIQDLSEKVRQCLQEHKFTCDIRDPPLRTQQGGGLFHGTVRTAGSCFKYRHKIGGGRRRINFACKREQRKT